MMHQNGLIIAIKDEKGKVLREKREKSAFAVYLPFYTHYSIYLKNDNDRNAIAKIEIDGTQVLGTHEIIVPAKGNVTVERFCIDGDLNKGNKFYFVPKDDGRVSDPTAEDNGVMKVTFVLEEEKPKVIETHHHHHHDHYNTTWVPGYPYWYDKYWHEKPWQPSPYPHATWCSTGTNNVSNSLSRTRTKGTSINNTVNCSYTNSSSSANFADSCCYEMECGATVEGDASRQSFRYGSVGKLEKTETVIILELRPSKDALTVEQDRKDNKIKLVSEKSNVNIDEKLLKDLVGSDPEKIDKLMQLLESLKK